MDDKINALGKYFGGYSVMDAPNEQGKITTFKLLKIKIPNGWDLYPVEEVKYSITPNINQQTGECELYGVGEIGLSGLCDFAQEIIKHNLDKKAKFDLFQTKIAELNDLFDKTTLEDLKRLTFGFNNAKENNQPKITKGNKKEENRGLLVENDELTNSKIEL